MASFRDRMAKQTENLRAASDIPQEEAKDSRIKTGPRMMAALALAQVRIQELEAEGGPSADLPTANISPNPWQPRTSIDPEALNGLATSIQSLGLIQPIIVRPTPGVSGQYQLVAGERRLRAVQQLGSTKILARIADFDDAQMALCGLGKVCKTPRQLK